MHKARSILPSVLYGGTDEAGLPAAGPSKSATVRRASRSGSAHAALSAAQCVPCLRRVANELPAHDLPAAQLEQMEIPRLERSTRTGRALRAGDDHVLAGVDVLKWLDTEAAPIVRDFRKCWMTASRPVTSPPFGKLSGDSHSTSSAKDWATAPRSPRMNASYAVRTVSPQEYDEGVPDIFKREPPAPG
jgi:hypothetical protein